MNNLLSNAIKYTREGTVTLSVLCETMPNDANALVSFIVRDTGIGIRAEDTEKLFTSYTQLDIGANSKIEGTGLGLAITKKLVEMMGGSISVETAEALRGFRYAPEGNEITITRLWLPDCKVLVVDDIPDNLHVAQGLLAPYGLQVDHRCFRAGSYRKSKKRRFPETGLRHYFHGSHDAGNGRH